FRPNDEAAYQKYADLLFTEAKANPTSGEIAADGIEAFLRAFPNHPAERQKLVELYLTTGQVSKLATAKQHLAMLFSLRGGEYRSNIDVLEMAAECEQGLGDLPAAIAHLEEAIKTGKAPVRVYVQAMRLHFMNREDPKRDGHIDDHLRALREGPLKG